MGVLTATGMIVGDSLWGVTFGGIVYFAATDTPLALAGDGWESWALPLGTIVFAALAAALYRNTRRTVART
jgi:hypothetical protein